MAPALTQTVDPPNLADATRHSPPPKPATSSSSPYDHLKEHRNIRTLDLNAILLSGQTLIPNGDCVPLELAPPACGQAEGRPAPTNSPYRPNMDGHLSLPIDDQRTVTQLPVSSITPSVDSNMGLQSFVTNITVASDPVANEKGSEATTSSSGLEDTPNMLGNQNELLALVGRDFNNVNDIIDTLQRLASNPELLDAAARDLEPDNGSHYNSQIFSSEDRAALILAKLNERQSRLENRRLFLLRRLHRITSRGLGMTISNQVCHLIRHSRSMVENELTKFHLCEKAEVNVRNESLPSVSLKSLSTSDLGTLVRKMDASQNIHKDTSVEKQLPSADVLTFSSAVKSQLDTVTANMKAAALGHVHHDSDATESSSGGESCDEVESFHKSSTDYKPVKERAYYRYCRTRGWVASKWMWLQAQIADLDSKINQQEKLYSNIRASKNTVMLSSESVSAQQKQTLRSPAHLDMQDPALTCIASPSSVRSTLNGYHPTNKVDDSPLMIGLYGGVLDNGGSARTVGVHKVKRRRYVRPNLSMVMKRSLGAGGTTRSVNKYRDKVSHVLCKCVPPLSCILCVKSNFSNRNVYYGNCILNSNKSKVLTLLTHPVPEQLTNLDPAYHPVLSDMTELLQSEYYKATIGSFEWQRKTLQGKSTTIAHQLKKEIRLNRSDLEEELDCLEPHLKKRRKDFKKNGKKFREDVKERLTSYMHRSTRRDKALLEDYEDEYGEWHVSVSSTNSSPCPSPAPSGKAERLTKVDKLHSDYKEGSGRILRKHAVTTTTPSAQTSLASAHKHKANVATNSYDINNIVIPYNMAASARVELLKYKEIPTPKWRIEEIKPIAASKKNRDELDEDISEDAVIARHGRSEAAEREKYSSNDRSNACSTRSSRSRRTDSSGTNTPDHPLSPRLMEHEQGESSPIGSPPSTPTAGPSEDSNHSLSHTSAASKSQATVLTLSLSSLQSSLLDSKSPHNSSSEPINKHLINQASYSEETSDTDFTPVSTPIISTSLVPLNSASTYLVPLNSASTSKEINMSTFISEVQPGSCPERFVIGNGTERRTRVISITLGDEQNERDRISPFPCRDFPLTENDYQDLVIEDLSEDNDPSEEIIEPPGPYSIETDMEESQIVIVDLNRGDVVDATDITGNIKSGRDSPLSELTDSAPEEDGVWDDETTPDWTISAVHDRSGGLVLQVQKN